MLAQVFGLKRFLICSASFNQFIHRLVSSTGLRSSVARDVVFDVHGMNIIAKKVFPVKTGHFFRSVVKLLRNDDVFASPNVCYFHHVQGEGTSFVGANVVSATHDLARG